MPGIGQGLLAALAILPLAIVIPATRPDLQIHWTILLAPAALAALMRRSPGRFLGAASPPA